MLAQAGVASRRAAEELIAAGRVSVDGQVVREMGRRVDPDTAVVHVDGSRIVLREDLVHLALNKPRGMLSTMSDDRGRPCVGDLVAERGDRLFHVGRLDAETEGLLLLTNDGDLGHRLMHPSYEMEKTYLAEVAGQVPRDLGRRLRDGVELDDGPVAVHSFKLVDSHAGRSLVELVIHEGRKHVVRRLLDEVGHPVQRLVRTAIGDVVLGNQRPGQDPGAQPHRGRVAVPSGGPVAATRPAPARQDGERRSGTGVTGRLHGVVAMDGPSGTGKSTVSRRLAAATGARRTWTPARCTGRSPSPCCGPGWPGTNPRPSTIAVAAVPTAALGHRPGRADDPAGRGRRGAPRSAGRR